MRYFITGANGQLGYDLKQLLKNETVLATDVDVLDITDGLAVMKTIEEFKPDVVFHCAAWTAVDLAEDEADKCFEVNVVGTRNIVEAAKSVGAKVVYISTDYVFDGETPGEYEVDSKTGPVSIYGKTKLQGEEAVLKYDKSFIVRISWVFGINGNNFVKTMLRLGKTMNELNVVSDQVGSPTYTLDLSYLLYEISNSDKYGIYHATNEGFCNWAEFAQYIFKSANLSVKVNGITTAEYPTNAVRPSNSKMSKKSLVDAGFKCLPKWEDATKRYIDELMKMEEE